MKGMDTRVEHRRIRVCGKITGYWVSTDGRILDSSRGKYIRVLRSHDGVAHARITFGGVGRKVVVDHEIAAAFGEPGTMPMGEYDGKKDTHGTGQTGVHAGEENHTAKLTANDVREIRAITGRTAQEIAERYGVSRKTIHSIRQRVTWRHI